jgi:hypothetical protein
MNAPAALSAAIASARRRRGAIGVALALPLLAGAGVLAWRTGGVAIAAVVVAIGGVATGAWLRRELRALDPRWAARRLDADPAREDSSDLLFRDPATLGPLQRLQRERVADRLAGAIAELRPAWPRRALAASWLGGIAAIALALAWPTGLRVGDAPTARKGAATAAPTHTTLVAATLAIAPPAYTGIAKSSQPELSAKVPAGTTLRWELALAPEPRAAELRFHDGRRVALARDGGRWRGQAVLDRSALYSLVIVDGLPLADGTRHRLDAVPDAPPQLRIVTPERSLSMRTAGQRGFALRVEARDDHGLGAARWIVTHAQGTGEQVTVTERTLAARGDGDAHARRYATTLDLASLGFAQGDDLIVRLEVADNRAPAPQRARSASMILRWPPPASTESTGMEGLVKRALPAYFRSQRQIIIDTEALVRERGRLAGDRFGAKSDAIAVDQRILRMRYGEFLGEEDEGHPDAVSGADKEHAAEPPSGFGAAVDVLGEYGHTHDDAEAATLLDPKTRALLKQALDAMWQSEAALRQAKPEQALPHEYRALAFIKQVQQATRIYLARVGLELPPIDEARRMTGVRDGIADRRDGSRAADVPASPALTLWQALGAGAPADAPFAAFATWLRGHEAAVDDPLDLQAALDAARTRPGCAECRVALRARLWPLLPRTVPVPAARARPTAEGAAYLDGLGEDAR